MHSRFLKKIVKPTTGGKLYLELYLELRPELYLDSISAYI